MKSYHQYCPIARASEILAQRWTPLIVRELLNAPSRYSPLAQALPGISRTLLTSRLRELQDHGLVETTASGSGSASLYGLTAAGKDLGEVMQAIGAWGERWLEVGPQHADPASTLNAWATTYLAIDKLPAERVVTRFEFRDRPSNERTWWVLFDGANTEVCRKVPEFEEDLNVVADSVALTEWHLGRISWSEALAQERITVEGLPRLARALPTWNRRSRWVDAQHPTPTG